MSTIIIFLIVIIFLVVAHEFGHFYVAKLFGIRVEEFGIGYPPRAKKMFTWKGTLFTLNWLPFGGFVKIFGETAATDDKKGSFIYQKKYKRALVIVAGIVANMLIAAVLYAISFSVGFLGAQSDFPGSVALGPSQAIIADVQKGSPADIAGITSGEVVIHLESVNQKIDPATSDDVVQFIHAHPTDAITLILVQSSKEHLVTVTPKPGIAAGAPGIGIALSDATHLRLPFFRALKTGITYTGVKFKTTIITLATIIQTAVLSRGGVFDHLSGPVGVAHIAGQAYALGIGAFLGFVAFISVNLAVINLIPFPALDGGRLILELFSSNGKSKIPDRVVNAVNQGGFVLLILLMLVITYHDIIRLFA